MIENTTNGAPAQIECAASVTICDSNVTMFGLPIREEKYKLLESAVLKLGFESVEAYIDSSVEEAVVRSKALPDHEDKKEKEISNGITKARKEKNFTQTEIATMVGIDRSYYNLIENGFRLPSIDIVSKIAKLIGLSLEEFYKAHKELEKR